LFWIRTNSHPTMKRLPYVALPAFLSLLLLAGCNPIKSTATADKGVVDFHTLYDAKDYEGIYDAAHADFQNSQPKEEILGFMAKMREKTGAVKTTQRTGWEAKTFNMETDVVVVYQTDFENGPGQETFTFRIKDETASLRGWYLQSPLLLDPSLQKPQTEAEGPSEESGEAEAEAEAPEE